MASLLDFIPADNEAPAAVVRRRGESDSQVDARKLGYSDAQTGFDRSLVNRRAGAYGGRGNVNPLTRAYDIASRREVADLRDENADQARALRERELSLREREQSVREQVQASSEKDRMAQIDQTQGFLNELNDIETVAPRGTKDFYARALRAAAKYPHAINADPRIGQMLNHYEDSYLKTGGTEESAKALWELGQVDTNTPDSASYLQTIPGKYPGAFQSKEVQDVYKDVLRRIPGRTQLPAGMQTSGATVDEFGNTTVKYAAPQEQKQAAQKAPKMDTYEDFNRDLKAAKIAHGVINEKGELQPNMALPDTLQKSFEQRGRVLQGVNEFQDANAVKAALKANKIDRATAEGVLKAKFGFQ